MFAKLLSEIKEVGLTDMAIAEVIGTSQPSVTRLRNGQTKEPGYSIGTAILRLHRRICAKKKGAP